MSQRTTAATVTFAALFAATSASAGPPYATDDPEPVEYRHWELYLASQSALDKSGWAGTAPHVEVNYGVVPKVQLHVIAPFAYSRPRQESAAYGYGDTELGIKVRFLEERKWTPQIGTFPFLEVPTGSSRLGLGNGTAQVFLPVWLQKSFGSWASYGGAGVWIDAGQRDRHWWYFGWQVQRRLSKGFTLGAEVFHQTPKEHGGESDTRFNLGGVIDFTDTHHLLLSAGRGIIGPNWFQGYIAYLMTLGPSEEPRDSTRSP
jgi:hypothetical protein